MKKTINIIFICMVIVILFAIPCATYFSEKEEYSVFENRNLTTAPEFNTEAVMSGDYFDSAETYFKDHIVLRNKILESYTNIQMNILQKPVVSDIIITSEELLPYVTQKEGDHATQEEISAELEELKALKAVTDSYGGKVIYIGIPGQITMFSDLYPKVLSDIPSYNLKTEKLFANALEKEGIDFISARVILTKDNYFKTDHHYDLTGAYKIYEAMCEETGTEAVPETEFSYTTLTNTFYGSRSRKIYNLTPLSDTLTVIEPYTAVAFTRYDNGTEVEANVIDLPESEDEIVSYTQYMGGDKAETLIDTDREELPDILIYGDSYTNAVECFAYLSFDETRSLDLRHYSSMTLCEYVEKYKPDYVFCIRDDGNYVSLEGNGKTH